MQHRDIDATAMMRAHRPASTLIIGGLASPAWKVEMQGIAAARSRLGCKAVGHRPGVSISM
jgi:hypothetical protein